MLIQILVSFQTQFMLDQLTDLQRKVWKETLFLNLHMLFLSFPINRINFLFYFWQEHLLNEANKTLKQRVGQMEQNYLIPTCNFQFSHPKIHNFVFLCSWLKDTK